MPGNLRGARLARCPRRWHHGWRQSRFPSPRWPLPTRNATSTTTTRTSTLNRSGEGCARDDAMSVSTSDVDTSGFINVGEALTDRWPSFLPQLPEGSLLDHLWADTLQVDVDTNAVRASARL